MSPAQPQTSTHTVADLRAARLARQKARRRETTYTKSKYLWDSGLLPWLGADRPIDNLTRGEVQTWLDLPEQARRATHADNIAAEGRASYNLARMFEWTERNPFVGIDRYEKRPRSRVLSGAEHSGMLEWLADPDHGLRRDSRHKWYGARLWAADAIRLLTFTGARRGEILYLDWSEVDLDSGVLVLPPERHKTGSRTGREKIIYLPPVAVQLLRAMRPRDSGRVFPCSYATLRRTFETMRADIGAPDITLHDLRRSWSTAMAEAGVDTNDVAAVLGQTSLVQARHYRHLRPDRLRALAALAGSLMAG